MLDNSVLTPALSKLLAPLQPQFDDGGLVVEIRDYRNRDMDPCPYDGQPTIFKMFLRPTQHTLLTDLESETGSTIDVVEVTYFFQDFL